MRISIPVRRLALTGLSAFVAIGLCILGVLAHPEPLYAYHAEAGRLRLYSDRPFDVGKGRAILADVERRLDTAPPLIRDSNSVYRVFVTNAEWRRRLTFLWNYGVGGVNYYPIGGSVFLRQGEIDEDRLRKTNGARVEPPRTLAYFAAHEIGHSLIGRRTGALANWRLPAWVREGLADYVAFGGSVDIPGLTKRLRADDPDLDPKRSGLYARYTVLVAYFLEREHWTVDQLLATKLSRADAERRLLARVVAE